MSTVLEPSLNDELPGEISGALLLGIVHSFYDLSVIEYTKLPFEVDSLRPDAWYPYPYLIHVIRTIESNVSISDSLLFQAGINFLKIWYEHGPGKEMVFSTMDWLHTNDSSAGYNSVVRGGTPDEIGWCKTLSINEQKGIAVIENVMPIMGEYIKGVFYGGCHIFDDMSFISVEADTHPYPKNTNFLRTNIVIHFRLKSDKLLQEKLDKLQWGGRLQLNDEEVDNLVWMHKGLRYHYDLSERYKRDIFELLTSAFVNSRKVAAELEIAKKQAESANQAKSAFLANMSHELRTPLNSILGFTQIMQLSPELDEEHKQDLQFIYKGGRHLLNLINDILDIATVEAGRLELFPEQVEVESFFYELVEMFRRSAEDKGIAFDYQTETSLPYSIHIDPQRLRQVVINILGNAVKFTKQGQVGLNVTFHDSKLHIRVTDTGPGIAPEQYEEIFVPFSQVGDKEHKIQGTGLGLAITRKIIKLMGGRIELDSQLGQGSSFHLLIPVEAFFKEPPYKQPEAFIKQEIIGYHGLRDKAPFRILITDDISDNREVLYKMLQPLGFELHQADSGEACLQIAPNLQPHLVLMDFRMPGLDGLQTTQKLHALKGLENLPIIIVSASAYEEDKEAAISMGCADYIKKPIDRELLLQALQKHLPLEWRYVVNA